MKKLLTVIFGLLGAFVVAALVVGANYTATKELPTDPRYVDHRSNREIAWTNTDLVGLIAAFNATDTSLSEIETASSEIETAYELLFIPVPLTGLREVDATGDVGNNAANGGVLASDTTPILEAINGGTDNAQRLHWAASNVDPVMYQVALPPDFDTTSNLVIHYRGALDVTTDSFNFQADVWFNESDTKIDATTDLDLTLVYTEFTATVTAANIPTGAQTMTFTLTPETHANSVGYLSALWIEAARAVTH